MRRETRGVLFAAESIIMGPGPGTLHGTRDDFVDWRRWILDRMNAPGWAGVRAWKWGKAVSCQRNCFPFLFSFPCVCDILLCVFLLSLSFVQAAPWTGARSVHSLIHSCNSQLATCKVGRFPCCRIHSYPFPFRLRRRTGGSRMEDTCKGFPRRFLPCRDFSFVVSAAHLRSQAPSGKK